VEFTGLSELTEHVNLSYRLEIAEWCRSVGELCLLRIPWRNPGSEIAAAADAARQVPFVAPNPAIIHETLEIKLPRDLLPYDLPAEITSSCDWGLLSCSLTFAALDGAAATHPSGVADGILIAKREVRFLGGVVPPERFGEWRQFRDAIVRADNTDVVLLSERAAAALNGEGGRRFANQPEGANPRFEQ
jgi:hypothetical protein